MASLNRGKQLREMPYEDYREKARQQISRSVVAISAEKCWVWGGNHQKNGYGQTRFLGKMTPAHRASYLAFVGSIPEGFEVCHRCDVRNCVNPDHLFLATHLENMRDMIKKGRRVQGVCRPRRGAENRQSKAVEVKGKVFGSIHQAERELGVSHGSVRYWIRTGKAKLLDKEM